MASAQSEDDDEFGRVAWFDRPCDFETLSTMEEFNAALAEKDGKLKAVEFFAGWCTSCKTSFPALCKIPKEPELKGKFRWYKANIENYDFMTYIKERQISGIPHMVIFTPEGKPLIGLSTGFKKMAAVKDGLKLIVQNPEADRFVLDPNGFVVVPPE